MGADAGQIVDRYLASLGGATRRVAEGEWGLTVDAAGWPLHVGIALRDGLLQAQAQVVDAGVLEEHALLFWNRSLPLVRFAHTGALSPPGVDGRDGPPSTPPPPPRPPA